jgi:hypothetical protein
MPPQKSSFKQQRRRQWRAAHRLPNNCCCGCQHPAGKKYRYGKKRHRALQSGHEPRSDDDETAGHLGDEKPEQGEIGTGIDKAGHDAEQDHDRARRLELGTQAVRLTTASSHWPLHVGTNLPPCRRCSYQPASPPDATT